MWWCPCWPQARQKPVISYPQPSKLRPLTLVGGPPRPAPKPPGQKPTTDALLQLENVPKDDLMQWLDDEMARANLIASEPVQTTHIHAPTPVPFTAAQKGKQRARIPTPPSPQERAYTPENGSTKGMIIHMGADASASSTPSDGQSKRSSGSSSSHYSTHYA